MTELAIAPLDIATQLADLARLEGGWLEGAAECLADTAVAVGDDRRPAGSEFHRAPPRDASYGIGGGGCTYGLRLLRFLRRRMMQTDRDIDELVRLPKVIVERTPAGGYREQDGQRRCDLSLDTPLDQGEQVPEDGGFSVFIRQNTMFIDNFSIGLRFQSFERPLRVVLVRYNGPHGEVRPHSDGHHHKPHIHRLTAAELDSGSFHPREKHREITDKYVLFDQAIDAFFRDIGVRNYQDFFPNQLQRRLFGEH